MGSLHQINVHIGEIKIGKPGDKLRAILGSCVGIAIIWRTRHVCALAHCLLPESPNQINSIGGRFVNQAIPSLLILLRAKLENYSELEAIVVGGGNMTQNDPNHSKFLVGTLNGEIALKCLKELKIKVIHQELGGEVGRTISIDCASGSFSVQELPRLLVK